MKGVDAVKWTWGWIVVGGLLLPAALWAEPLREVLLNGVPVRDPRGLRLQNVDVEIDRDGTLRIVTRSAGERGGPEAAKTRASGRSGSAGAAAGIPGSTNPPAVPSGQRPGPEAGSSPQGPPVGAPDGGREDRDPRPLEGRYWIATRDLGTQPAGWAVDVQLNGQRLGTFTSGEPRVVEVTTSLRRGENVIRLEFRRISSTAPPSEGEVAFELVLAPGAVQLEQDSISLAYPILTAKRGASEEPGPPEELRFILPPPVRP